MASNGQDVRKMVERLQRRVGQLEQVAAFQHRKIEQLESLVTAQGIEIDTAQIALLEWMSFGGEHWAALREKAVALRSAGMAAFAIFRGWSEAFGHLVEEAPEVESPAEDEAALPTPVGGDNAGAAL